MINIKGTDHLMLNDKQSVRKRVLARNLVAVATSAILAGCAVHEGGQRMKMGAMQDSPMHQMMQELGCAHSSSHMQAMKKMTPEEKHAHMKLHMQKCRAKVRQEAIGEAMARIDNCVRARMSSRHTKPMNKIKIHARVIAEIRACANKVPQSVAQPTSPSTHDGH